jgi:hypothetical protein
MYEPLRSHSFVVTIGEETLPVMKVSGLAHPQFQDIAYHEGYNTTTSIPGQPVTQVIRLVKTFNPDSDMFFRQWFNDKSWRPVRVEVKNGYSEYPTATVLDFNFKARPKALFYSELDAGSNTLFLENLQLTVDRMDIT